MLFKQRAGLVPEFRPYDDLQAALQDLFGAIHPAASWLLSFVNGALVLGFVFGRTYGLLPGKTGFAKGFIFGVMGWIAMGVFFFPVLGRGLFAAGLGLGAVPAMFSLAMVLTYSIVLGLAYSAFAPNDEASR
jgi:hypothetical protein